MRSSTPTRTVYIVDGDASVRDGLSRLMDSANLEARPFANVADLLDQAHWIRAACVLLDVAVLRNCDAAGNDALHKIAKVLPIIALSADDDAAASNRARALGARSFFHKPVDSAALLDAIDWAIQSNGRSTPPENHEVPHGS